MKRIRIASDVLLVVAVLLVVLALVQAVKLLLLLGLALLAASFGLTIAKRRLSARRRAERAQT